MFMNGHRAKLEIAHEHNLDSGLLVLIEGTWKNGFNDFL